MQGQEAGRGGGAPHSLPRDGLLAGFTTDASQHLLISSKKIAFSPAAFVGVFGVENELLRKVTAQIHLVV